MSTEERTKRIREHERLRKLAHELDVQSTMVDRRLVESELLLPGRRQYLGDASSEEE